MLKGAGALSVIAALLVFLPPPMRRWVGVQNLLLLPEMKEVCTGRELGSFEAGPMLLCGATQWLLVVVRFVAVLPVVG